MPITLQEFATGDTNYILKHNANVSALVSFLNSLEYTLASVGGQGSGLTNAVNIGRATYGDSGVWLVGSDSFTYTLNGSVMTVSAGFAWFGGSGLMRHIPIASPLNFVGLVADTYYVRFNLADQLYVDTITTEALYRVVWDGTGFVTITPLGTVVPMETDIADLNVSQYSGITYLTPKDRLLATEKAFSAMLTADMSGGNFTPTNAQAMEAIGFKLIGDLTLTNTLTVPAKAKVMVIRNETTTSNASGVIVKTAAGTGPTLLAGEHAVLYCDGTNVLTVFRQGGAVPMNSLIDLDDTPASYSTFANKILRVRGDEAGIEFVDASALTVPSLAVQDEGTPTASAVATMNFAGSGVTVTESSPGVVLVTVPGGNGAALAVDDEGGAIDAAVVRINFVGEGVTVTQSAPGNILVTIPGGAGGGSIDYDLAFFLADKRPAGETVFRHTFTKAVAFAANFAGSDSDAITAATAQSVFNVKKNGVNIGTLTFAAAGTVGAFSTSGNPVTFVVGDILAITAPDPQDNTLAGVSITFAGTRT